MKNLVNYIEEKLVINKNYQDTSEFEIIKILNSWPEDNHGHPSNRAISHEINNMTTIIKKLDWKVGSKSIGTDKQFVTYVCELAKDLNNNYDNILFDHAWDYCSPLMSYPNLGKISEEYQKRMKSAIKNFAKSDNFSIIAEYPDSGSWKYPNYSVKILKYVGDNCTLIFVCFCSPDITDYNKMIVYTNYFLAGWNDMK